MTTLGSTKAGSSKNLSEKLLAFVGIQQIKICCSKESKLLLKIQVMQRRIKVKWLHMCVKLACKKAKVGKRDQEASFKLTTGSGDASIDYLDKGHFPHLMQNLLSTL